MDTTTDARAFWLALWLVPGVGIATYRRLVERFGSPERVLRARESELRDVGGVEPRVAESVARFPWRRAVSQELRRLDRLGADVLTLEDPRYPSLLKAIPDPPPVLYVKGTLAASDRAAVAVVGSRRPGHYGLCMAERLSRELARVGVTVVSGLARGIDAKAHRAALDAGGRTLAVLGCGLDVAYPPEHAGLMEAVARSGAVVTEFPLGTPPEPRHFPRRNRLISGLSLGTVVVEAARGSGSLITAHLALEQGREVFAVPGNVTSGKSAGAHALIKQGAKLVEQAEDILEEILPQLAERVRMSQARETGEQTFLALSPEEETLRQALSHDPVHIDALIAATGLPASRVSSLLMGLELKGAVKQLPGMQFVLAPRWQSAASARDLGCGG